MRKFFSISPIYLPQVLAFVRIITGCFMAYHGWEVFDELKMKEYTGWKSFEYFSSPALLVYAGKSAELIGGFLLAFGMFTRIAAIILVATMLYISFFVGQGKIWYQDQHPFLFVLLGIIFLFSGPGKFSLDAYLVKKNSN